MPSRRRTSYLVAVVLSTVGLSSCSDTSDQAPKAAVGTPLRSYATDNIRVARADFCEQIDPLGVERALATKVAETNHYGNGEKAELTPSVTDIAHEFNCTYRAADGTVARGWVFAPPVTTNGAAKLVRRSQKEPGCRRLPDAATFGNPSTATMCQPGGVTVLSFRGLFGDAWLSCSLSVPSAPDELTDRTGRWCVEVAKAATESPRE
jgi:hypothetical protein